MEEVVKFHLIGACNTFEKAQPMLAKINARKNSDLADSIFLNTFTVWQESVQAKFYSTMSLTRIIFISVRNLLLSRPIIFILHA